MKTLSQSSGVDTAPLLSVITEYGCSAQELRKIAVFLEAQTLKCWQWLHCSATEAECLAAADEAILLLPRAPKKLRATALEEAVWFLLSRPALPWVELNDGARGADQFIGRESLPEGRIGLRLNGRKCPGASLPVLPRSMQNGPSKRLLLLAPWFEPGGADRCNLDILQTLARKGWVLTVIASLAGEHRWLDRFTAVTADIWVLPHFLVAEKAFDFLAYLLDSRQPDLVLLSNSAFAYDALEFIQARRPGLPLVDLNHMEEAWGDGGHPGCAARRSALLEQHWVVSTHLRQWMVDRGVEAGKIEVLHWFADVERWKPSPEKRAEVRARLGIGPECVLIAYAGRICRQKRPDLFAATLAELARSHESFAALVMGDGELAEQLRDDLRHRGLEERVRMLGWQSEEALRDLFQAADVFFLPSAGEGIALVLYEAMACGMAIVAAEVGGQAELVSPQCGYLVPRYSLEQETRDYAARLRNLLDDPALLKRMGHSSALRIREAFSVLHFERRLLGLLATVQGPVSHTVHSPSFRPALGIRRLSMQWTSYRLVARLRRHPVLRAHGGLLRFLELLVKGLLFIRAFGISAVWRRIRKR